MTYSTLCTVIEELEGFDSSIDHMYLDKKSNWKRKIVADKVIWSALALMSLYETSWE